MNSAGSACTIIIFHVGPHPFGDVKFINHSNRRTYAAARLSELVKDAQSCEEDDTASPEDVELSKVESVCLEKVVEFLRHYEIEPMTEIRTPLVENSLVTQEWYRQFIRGLDQSMLFDLVTAANYMSIRT